MSGINLTHTTAQPHGQGQMLCEFHFDRKNMGRGEGVVNIR